LNLDRTFFRLALIGALTASLGLAACGRKGPLDLPPSGSSLAGDPQASAPAPSSPLASPIGGQSKSSEPGVGPDGKPQAPKGPNKRIFLDGLLD
jgi:predicted small lipoprotein YifL